MGGFVCVRACTHLWVSQCPMCMWVWSFSCCFLPPVLPPPLKTHHSFSEAVKRADPPALPPSVSQSERSLEFAEWARPWAMFSYPFPTCWLARSLFGPGKGQFLSSSRSNTGCTASGWTALPLCLASLTHLVPQPLHSEQGVPRAASIALPRGCS